MTTDAEIKELAAHYAHACGGDRQRALLMALDAGYCFDRVVAVLGDDGLQVAFRCITSGWIDRGQITDAGRAHLAGGSEA